MVKAKLEFSGGLEILFGNQPVVEVDVNPAVVGGGSELLLGPMLLWLRDNLLTERPELFLQGNTVTYKNPHLLAPRMSPCRRPGILVLVNDVDWELSGQLDTVIEDGDVIVFISTLHGG